MFTDDKRLYIAHCENGPLYLVGKMANRHGLIAGATGTGKTVTLQVIAESFSQAGAMSGFIEKRCPEFGITDPQFHGCRHGFLMCMASRAIL